MTLADKLRPDRFSAMSGKMAAIEPRIQRAVERWFTTERVPTPAKDVSWRVLVPREMRIWRSILDPVYQLFEALRRITEGEPGAAVCRECGERVPRARRTAPALL